MSDLCNIFINLCIKEEEEEEEKEVCFRPSLSTIYDID